MPKIIKAMLGLLEPSLKKNEYPTVGINNCSKLFLVPNINLYTYKPTLDMKCLFKLISHF